MKINKKLFIILLFAICIVSLLFGSVAYYRFLVSGNINGSTGNAVFNVTGFKDDSSSIKTIELGKISPGDSGEFTITLDASGSTVDMYATLSIDRGSGDTELPTNLKFYTTPDYKSELHKYYSFLETTGTQKEELTIYWYWNPFISDEEDNKYINREFSANIKVSAVQISEYAIMMNGNSNTSSTKSCFWKDSYSPYIRTITFGNDLSNKPESCTGDSDLCWDVSVYGSKKKIYAYLVDSGLKDSTDSTKVLYNLYIVSDVPIFAPENCSLLFSLGVTINSKYITNLVSINFNNNFNTSKSKLFSSQAYDGVFYRCSSLKELDLSSFNTANVIGMGSMFSECSSLKSLDLSNFNTSNVTTMYGMFYGCSSLTNLDLSSFNTSNVTSMGAMFFKCQLLTILDLSGFDTSKVTGMMWLFNNCSSLTSLDLSNFNTSNVTDMFGMFDDCSSLTSLDLSNFNTSKVTNMNSIFAGCSSLTELNLNNFNTSNVTNIGRMFAGCKSLENLNLSSFNTSNVTNMSGMFEVCSSLTTLDLNNFNTSKVTNMSSMFNSCKSLISLDLSNFDTSKVTNMRYMFSACSSLTELNLSSFDTSNVTSMQEMFHNCSKLQTEINIMNANATNYSLMFAGALSDPNAYVILGYTTATESIATAMKDTNFSADAKARIQLKQI